jgi:hypothetical protein
MVASECAPGLVSVGTQRIAVQPGLNRTANDHLPGEVWRVVMTKERRMLKSRSLQGQLPCPLWRVLGW